MIKDNFKENDIFVSALINPDANINDLVHGGLNDSNTLLLTPEHYKTSEFVKQAFTDKDGNFDESLFNTAYNHAAYLYQNLTDLNTSENIQLFVEYNPNDIYAPIEAKKTTPTYEISRIANPYEQIEGIRSLFGTVDSEKSVRELAQKSKIYDSETGEYLDKSAEDLGLFGGLFSTPLVYAKWDSDGDHIDPITGRTVKHKKGEYRLNDDGKFFTETIGKKQGYDQEFVALSDILTKEDTWLNKIDFFDSDDKEKSAAGTVMKVAASVAPYLVPGFNTIWGGVSAALALGSVLPTFAKALEGLVVGDKETSFTKEMSLFENYFKRFDNSVSDKGQLEPFGLESIGSTVSDIFAQLYQMRAAASLSKLAKLDWKSANAKAFENFSKNHKEDIAGLIQKGVILPTKEGISSFWGEIASQTPELKALIDKSSKLSRQLSLGYMAMLTSADVYKDAVEHGYSRRAAGAATAASLAALYYTMMSLDDRVSSWFLDSVVGYNEHANRLAVRKSVQPLYDMLEASVKKLPGLSKAEKQKEFANVFVKVEDAVKRTYYKLLDGTSEFWSRSTAEALEEVLEEGIMDSTKGAFDALASFGFLGSNNKQASFNTVDNLFSKEGAMRYAQNALGGFLGGGLFHLQEHYIEPLIKGQKIVPEGTKLELIKGIQSGEAEAYKAYARQLGKRDNFVSSVPIFKGDQIIEVSANDNTKTRGELIADKVVEYIEYLQGVLGSYDANLSGDDLVKKVIRDKGVLKALLESDITNLIIDDFDKNIVSLSTINSEIEELLSKENKTNDEELTLSNLLNKRKETEKEVKAYLDGEKEEFYLKAALAYLNPNIRNNITNISLYQFAKTKTGLEWNAIPDTGAGTTKESITAEYELFKNSTDKQELIKTLVNAMDDLEQNFSPAFKEYAGRYKDVRKVITESILSPKNYNLSSALSDDNFSTLVELSTALKNSGLKGVTLEDILSVDPDTIVRPIINLIYNNNQILFDSLAQAGETSTEELLLSLSNVLAANINFYPIEQWDSLRLNVLMQQYIQQIKEAINGESPSLELLLDTFLIPDNIREDLSKTAIKEYIKSLEVLDNELVKRLELLIVNDFRLTNIVASLHTPFDYLIQEVNEFIPEEEDNDILSGLFGTNQLQEIANTIIQAIKESKSSSEITELIYNKLLSLNYGDSRLNDLLSKEKSLLDYARNMINLFINANPIFKDIEFLKESKDKEIVNNPLFDLLRNLSIQLSPEVKTTIFDLLQNESLSLSGLSDITEYVKMPDVLEQISNAKSILKIAKAILVGMEDRELDGNHLFGYNKQVAKYLDTFKNGENADKYQTLKSQDIYTIGSDLDLLLNKLDFIELLANKNVASKAEEDKRTKEIFCKTILDKIKLDASKLQINGVSILPDDILSQIDDDSLPIYVRLGRIQHQMYEKFKALIDSGVLLELAITTLFDNLNLNYKEIMLSSLQSYGLSLNLEAISEYDYFVWLTTTLGSDQNEYYYKYKQYLQSLALDNTIVPLFIQEYNTQIDYGVLADTLGVHDAALKYLIDKSEGYPADTKRLIFVDGVSGSGKTTTVAKLLLEFTTDLNIFVAAPNNDTNSSNTEDPGQADKLKISLGLLIGQDKVFDKKGLLTYFIKDDIYNLLLIDSINSTSDPTSLIQNKTIDTGSYFCLSDNVDDTIFKDNIQPPKLIFIDEGTHFNTAEWLILDRAAQKYDFKIIVLGDTYQESANIRDTEAHIDQVFVWKGPRLGISIRPANVNKKDNIDRFLVALDSYYNEFRKTKTSARALQLLQNYLLSARLLIKYYEAEDALDGDKIVTNITKEDLNKLKRIAGGKKIGIITKLDDSGLIVDLNFKSILDSSDLTENDYILKSPDKIHPKAVQGAEKQYFVINDANISGYSTVDQIKKLYTLLTRSLSGSIIKLDQDICELLCIDNVLTAKPSIYKLPGTNLIDGILQLRLSDLTSIVGNQEPQPTPQPLPTPIPNPLPLPIPQPQPTPLPTPLPTPQPLPNPLPHGAIPDKNVPDEDLSQHPDLLFDGFLCYGFYTHTGRRNDGGQYVSNNRNIPLDLELIPQGLSTRAMFGFLKLKNLIALHPDTSSEQFKSDLNYSTFTEDIGTFIKEVVPKLKYYDTKSALAWLKDHLTIEKDSYIFGIRMNKELDYPFGKFGYDHSKLVEDGQPLLLVTRKIKISDTDFNFESYITVSSLPKSQTLLKAKSENTRTKLFETLKNFESKAALHLASLDYVIFRTPEEIKKIGNADGRVVKAKQGEIIWDSVSSLIAKGVNVKEIMLITDSKTQDGKYKFIEWAKLFNPAIVDLAFENNKFILSGRYAIRVSYTNSTDSTVNNISTTDHVLIVNLAPITVSDAITSLKEILGNLLKKREILHAACYSQLVTNVLSSLNAFGINSQLPINKILADFALTLSKNINMFLSKLDIIDQFIKNNPVINLDNIKKLFVQDGDIALLLTDWLITGQNAGQIRTQYKINVPKPNLKLYRNVSPVSIPDIRGVCQVAEGSLDSLGLQSIHYEPALFGLTENAIAGAEPILNLSATTTPQEESNLQDQNNVILPVDQEEASNSSNSISEELSDLIELKGWTIAPNSRDAKVMEVIKQIELLPEGYTLEDIIEITDDGILITEAALELLDDSIREAYDSIDNQDVSCTII